ncbi:ROK family protein [Oenococcus alcoholitolerans]|uniref:Transcriptional regulator n=1 Tax=Oenococcus alcoholitolerans TaxID=931074 RepID=A0ABR4XSP0_9LACO|nr:hypothetical protein Q757_00685 [Oenococcus alcoholitolerans]
MKNYLVFDIGGTKLKYALINKDGELLDFGSKETPTSSKKDLINEFKSIMSNVSLPISGIGISVPGKVDSKSQRISYGGSLPFLNGLSFGEELDLDIPIAVENDAKAATIADLNGGILKNQDSGAVLVLGTAIGGGIVLDNHLLYGKNDQAGEVSFMSLGNFSNDSLVGFKGSAVSLINKIAKHYHYQDINDGPAVFDLIEKGDIYAHGLFEEFCQTIAVLVHNIQTILDIDFFVIGGGISQRKIVVDGIYEALKKLRSSNSLVEATLKEPKIVGSAYKNKANLFGAFFKVRNMDLKF